MLLGENILLALRSLKTNKMRSFLTMLGIIIGIASVIAIFTVGNSLTNSVSENMQSLGANDVYVTIAPRSESSERDPGIEIDGLHFSGASGKASLMDAEEKDYITSDMIHDMADHFGDKIYAVNAMKSVGQGSITIDRETASVSVTGVSVGYFVTNKVDMDAGAMFSEKEFTDRSMVCLMEKSTAETLYGSAENAVGQTTKVTVGNNQVDLLIRGVYSNNSSMSQYSMFAPKYLYVPLRTGSQISHKEESFQYVQVISGVGVDPEALSKEITTFFEPYYRNNASYKVTALTLSGMVRMLTTLLGTITTAISIIAGISLLVGGIGVMNIMLVSVTERTREIGTRKALGAKNSSIRVQFIVEAMIICLIGGFIGLILGMVLGITASNILGYPARPSISGIIISIGFSMAIGLFFGYFPANKAAKMNPIDALRYE